jgi:hypothetical protein
MGSHYHLLLDARSELPLGEVATMAGVSVSRVSEIQRESEDEITDGNRAEASAGIKVKNRPFPRCDPST